MSSSGQFICGGTRAIARHRLLAVLAGGCLGFAGTASAETEVTLYGEIDAGLTYTTSASDGGEPPRGASRLAAASNNVGGSFFGLQGSEELGGGLTAQFTIERGIDVTNGEGNDGQPMFVGLSHTRAGTLTLGRQVDAISDYLAPLALTGSEGGTYFAHPLDNDNMNTTYLVNHTVKWQSPVWQGFQFGGQYALSPVRSSLPVWSTGASFASGPLSLAAGYAQAGSLELDEDAGAVVGQALEGIGLTNTIGRAGLDQRIYGTGINYQIGDVTLGTVWTHSRYEMHEGGNDDRAERVGRLDFNNYEVNTRYRATTALTLAAAYTFTQAKASSGDTQARGAWNQFGMQADYAVSKRTSFYLEGIYQQATDEDAVAFVNGVGPAASDRQTVVSLGMRHHF